MNPQLQALWPGHWPYAEADGVGLQLTGLPQNRNEFVRLLSQFGCHPKIGRMLVRKLLVTGVCYTTVRASLPFVSLKEHVEQHGVRLSIIPPVVRGKEK